MIPKNSTDTIYPVILTVPESDRHLTGREKTVSLSRHARDALKISAQKSGIVLTDLFKAENGAPLPFNGTYWSLTHKSTYVGGVVAAAPIGIDIERIRPVKTALYRKTADEQEWHLTDAPALHRFFRYWTAKEAVLKAVASGLKDLSKCRVIQVVDTHNLVIDCRGETWGVRHVFFDGHIASLVQTGQTIDWTLVKQNGQQLKI
jgi:4'-phosphopantetheinyl transferase